MTVRLGYVGCGFMAQKVHIPNLLSTPGCELVALAELRQELGRKVQASFAIEASCGNIRIGSSSVSRATKRTNSRACARSVAMSANLCCSAWKVPTGRPNCLRSFA